MNSTNPMRENDLRSIPLAMTWDLWQRGKWLFLAAVLGAAAYTGMLFGIMGTEGALASQEPSILNLHVVLMLLNGMFFGVAVINAQGSPTRLYVLSLAPTFTLVVWRLIPGMGAAGP